MEVYIELAKWTGWPAIVALLLLLLGIGGWWLGQRIEFWKDMYKHLEHEYGTYKSAADTSQSYLDIDYGIRIISPVNGENCDVGIEVIGQYKVQPPPETLRLFAVHPRKNQYGDRIWPQEIVREFSFEEKTWRAKVNIGGGQLEGWKIIPAVVGESTIVLWNYYYKVGKEVGWWEIDGWPQDVKKYPEVSVNRV